LNRELTPEEYALIEPILLEAHRKWNNRKWEEIVDKDWIVTWVKHMEYGDKKAEYIHLVTQLSELNFLDSRVDWDTDTFSPLARRVAKLMMQSGLCGEEWKSNPEVIAWSLSVPKINKGIQKEAPWDMIDIDWMQEIIDTITQTIKSSTSSSPRQYLINNKKYWSIVDAILSIEDTNQWLESRVELASFFLWIWLSESQKTAIQEAHKLEDNVATILRLKRDNTFTLDQAIILVELWICGIHSSSLNYNTILKQNVWMKSNRIYTDRWVEFNVSANLETTRQDRENILSLLWFETENEQLNKKMSMEVTLERPRQWMLKWILKAKGITVEVTINTPTSFNLDLIEINRNKLPRGLKAKEIIKNIVLHAEHIWFKEMTLNADRLDETSWIPPYMMPSHLKWYAVWPLYWFQENVSYRPSESIWVINTAIHAGLQQLENTEVWWKEHFANELIIYYKRRWFDVPATAVQDVYNNYDICIQKVNKIINDYQSNTIEYQSWKRSIIQQLYSIPLWREFWYIYGQGREWSLPIDRSHSGMRQFLRHTNR
jgi:hypothetical protein